MDDDILVKYCVVGQASVGKTSMLNQYINKQFENKVRPTIGCDFCTKVMSNHHEKLIRLQIWDIAGQQRFHSVSKMYLRGALGCVIVCSAIDKNTVNQAIKWKRVIEEYSQTQDIPCILAQNKSDLILAESPEQHQKQSYLKQFVDKCGLLGYLQCSAKLNLNIDQIFQKLLDQTIKRDLIKDSNSYQHRKSHLHNNNHENSFKLNSKIIQESRLKKYKKKCCQ